MAKVFKPVRLGTPWRKGQHGIETIQSLNGRLFIDAEDRRVGRRMQVEANDLCSLGLKVRVIADHVVAQPVRLQSVAMPDPGHPHVGGLEFFGQPTGAPLRAAVSGAAPRPLQDPGFQLRRTFRCGAHLVPGDQATQALRAKAPQPPLHIGSAARQTGGDLPQTSTARHPQDHPRALAIFRSQAARAHTALEFAAFFRSQDQVVRRHELSVSSAVAYINVTFD